mgnify:CR=1 FL=1|jgi:hypothetical protein
MPVPTIVGQAREVARLLDWSHDDMGRYLGEGAALRLHKVQGLTPLEADALQLLYDVVQQRKASRLHSLTDLGEVVQDRIKQRGRCGAIAYLHQLNQGV